MCSTFLVFRLLRSLLQEKLSLSAFFLSLWPHFLSLIWFVLRRFWPISSPFFPHQIVGQKFFRPFLSLSTPSFKQSRFSVIRSASLAVDAANLPFRRTRQVGELKTHGFIGRNETWNADLPPGFHFGKSRIGVTQTEKNFEVAHMLTNINEFIVGISGQRGLYTDAIGTARHYIDTGHNGCCFEVSNQTKAVFTCCKSSELTPYHTLDFTFLRLIG